MKSGDLVKYTYGSDHKQDADGFNKGDLGVIIDSQWMNNDEVAEVFFFNANDMKRSYKKYLEVVSGVRNASG